jgi:hypothetical protein
MMRSRGLTSYSGENLRCEFFHECDPIPAFLFCREEFIYGFMPSWIPEKTAGREKFVPNPKLRLQGQLREVMRFHHYSIRTEEAYWQWIKRFIFFHQKRHPKEMGPVKVRTEWSLITLAYNLKRVLNLVNFQQLLSAVG